MNDADRSRPRKIVTDLGFIRGIRIHVMSLQNSDNDNIAAAGPATVQRNPAPAARGGQLEVRQAARREMLAVVPTAAQRAGRSIVYGVEW
eukprot:COSAG02_NODE_258_length_26815_cov_12.034998_17_plen_90_part_00